MKRQFDANPTWSQKIFDIIVCVVLLPLFLGNDPGLFTSYELGVGGEFQILAYGLVALEIVVLLLWLGLGKRAPWAGGVFCGMFLVGSVFVLPLLFYLTAVYPVYPIMVAGVFVTLPLLLFQALIGKGPAADFGTLEAFGFACQGIGYILLLPAFALICFRNAVRALRVAAAYYDIRSHVTMTCILGMLLALAGPPSVQAYASYTIGKCIRQLRKDDPRAQETIQQIKISWWCGRATFDRFVYVYFMEPLIVPVNPKERALKKRLAAAYRQITGWDINDRWADIGN